MKPTTHHKWVHVLCALWIHDITFNDDWTCINLSKLSKERIDLICSVCKKTGGCIQCSRGACVIPYHATCARMNGQYMGIQEQKKKKGKKTLSKFKFLMLK